jgi:hypothetical protein
MMRIVRWRHMRRIYSDMAIHSAVWTVLISFRLGSVSLERAEVIPQLAAVVMLTTIVALTSQCQPPPRPAPARINLKHLASRTSIGRPGCSNCFTQIPSLVFHHQENHRNYSLD